MKAPFLYADKNLHERPQLSSSDCFHKDPLNFHKRGSIFHRGD